MSSCVLGRRPSLSVGRELLLLAARCCCSSRAPPQPAAGDTTQPERHEHNTHTRTLVTMSAATIDLAQLLGDSLVTKDGKFPVANLAGKVVALYFSAHWCQTHTHGHTHGTGTEALDTRVAGGSRLAAARAAVDTSTRSSCPLGPPADSRAPSCSSVRPAVPRLHSVAHRGVQGRQGEEPELRGPDLERPARKEERAPARVVAHSSLASSSPPFSVLS